MNVLGIGELDNDAGACATIDGKVAAAANEERFSRVKQHAGFPFQAVEWICRYTGLKPSEFDGIAIAKPRPLDEIELVAAPLLEYGWNNEKHSTGLEKWLTRQAFRFYRIPKHKRSVLALDEEFQRWLGESGIEERKVYRVDHHRAHALSAYFASGFDSALVATCDGQGAGVTGTIWEANGKELERLSVIRLPHSMGNFYAAATKALGFIPNRHEGKVTGLAAYGDVTQEDLESVRRWAWFEGEAYHSPCIYGVYPKIRKFLDRVGKERFTGAFQTLLEEATSKWVGHYIQRSGLKRVALAGGVFANVKLNQAIAETPGVEEVFVFPGMADGGLGHGAAIGWDLDCGPGESAHGIEDVYWGPEPTDEECRSELEKQGWSFSKPANLVEVVADLLAEGKVVAILRGRMEFGPRALGHRSILHQPTDPSVNDWLNKKLRRTEFMPFAPVTRMEEAARCYPDLASRSTARFMTITTHCSKEMEDLCPAVVHVDGTARPQLVEKDSEPFYHGVLKKYEAKTGLPAIINTSFNLHEEPIVRTPADAIRAVDQARLDYLVLGDYLAEVP